MSSLWTPDGERPIRREPAAGPESSSGAAAPAESADASDPLRAAAAALGLDLDAMSPEDREQLRAELEEMLEARRRTASVPASELLARYLMQLGDVVTIYLEADPPAFGEAATVLEAIRGALDGVSDRLGEHEAVMREMLGQLQMIFVQVKERSGA
jgi:hypothetical protein